MEVSAPSRASVDSRPVFLSTLSPGPGERRLAFLVVVASAAVFLAAVPFAKQLLPPVSGFIPTYQSALVINDLVTAVLLFGQFTILRSPALLVLASGYLFTAFMAFAHLLTFPGLFAPTGLLGAGPQSTAWLYMFWHGGFPVLVIVYALLTKERRVKSCARGPATVAVVVSVASALLLACALTLLGTAGQASLPAIMVGNH